MQKVNDHTLYLNSKNRDEGVEENYTVFIKEPIRKAYENSLFLFRLINCNIPYSFNQINSLNNEFYVKMNHDVLGVNIHTLSFSHGNPNILDLNSDLASLINQIGVSLYGSDPNFQAIFEEYDQKNLFSYTNVDFLSIELYHGSTIARMLGVREFNQVIIPNIQVKSTACVNCNPISMLYIRSDSIKPINCWENILEKINKSDVIGQILVDQNTGFFITLNQTNEGVFITNDTINRVNLYLSSSDDYVLSLNNLDWTSVVKIEEWVKPGFPIKLIEKVSIEEEKSIPELDQILEKRKLKRT